MAGTINSEGAVTAIKSILNSGLAAQLDVVDTQHGDDITLEDIEDIWEQHLPQYDAYPCLVVVCVESVKPDPLRPEDIHFHQIEIDVVTTDRFEGTESLKAQEELTRRLNRTAEAIVRLFELTPANQRLQVSGTDNADRVYYNGTSRIDLRGVDDPNDQILGYVTVSMEVRISC